MRESPANGRHLFWVFFNSLSMAILYISYFLYQRIKSFLIVVGNKDAKIQSLLKQCFEECFFMVSFNRFVDYMWNGPRFENGRYLRQNYHVADTTWLKGTTYCYDSSVTPVSEDEEKQVREVSKSFELTTPSPKVREASQAKFDQMGSQTFWVGTLSGLGTVGFVADLTYFGGMNTTVALVGAIFTGVFSASAFWRSGDAYSERAKWDDPIDRYRFLRQRFHTDFRGLKDNNYKGVFFTEDETRDVLFRTMNNALSDFDRSQTSGNPERFIRGFLKNTNPLLPDSIDYAFEDQEKVFNPRTPHGSFWVKSEIMNIAYKALDLAGNLQDFDIELDNKLMENRQWYEKGNFGVSSTGLIVDEALYRQKEASLEPLRKQRDERIAALNRSLRAGNITQAEYENSRRSINAEFYNNPAVKKINNSYWNNSGTSTVAHVILKGALAIAEQHSTEKLKAQGRKEMLEKFRKPTSDCLKDYRDARKSPPKSAS